MDQSGVIVGGIAGAILAAVVFALVMVPPPEATQPEISVVADEEIIEESSPSYSKELSLIEIFENSESGVVRVNVQKNSDELSFPYEGFQNGSFSMRCIKIQ